MWVDDVGRLNCSWTAATAARQAGFLAGCWATLVARRAVLNTSSMAAACLSLVQRALLDTLARAAGTALQAVLDTLAWTAAAAVTWAVTALWLAVLRAMPSARLWDGKVVP